MLKKTIITLLGTLAVCLCVNAQNPNGGPAFRGKSDRRQEPNRIEGNDSWKQKVEKEKLDFFCCEMALSDAETVAFTEIYQEYSTFCDSCITRSMKVWKKLNDAVCNAADADYNALIEEYVSSKEEMAKLDAEFKDELLSVLPAEKVAKYYVADENFRRKMIHRLNEGGGPKDKPRSSNRPPRGPQGPRPE